MNSSETRPLLERPGPPATIGIPDFGIILALILSTWAVYSQTLDFEFVGADDHRYITENVTVQGGLSLSNTGWALTTFSESNWHPLTWLSHMLDIEMYGLEDPGGHHLSNVILHLLNSVLLFLLLRSLTGTRWRAGLVAALFALHPLHVESVAWVSERKDVLSTLFWLISIGFYAQWVRQQESTPRPLWLGLSLAAMALGLMAKPMLVTLPFVLLLLDYWPLGRMQHQPLAKLVREKALFFVLAGCSSLFTLAAQSGGGAMGSGESVGLGLRVANAAVSYVRYLGKAIWPADLAILYPHPNIPGGGGVAWDTWQIAGAVGLLALLSAAAFLLRRRHPYVLLGWLGFLGTLVPVIGIIQVGTQAMADRYTYVPMIWIFIAFSWGAFELAKRAAKRVPVAPALAGALLIAWLVTLGVVAHGQVRHWRNSVSLFEHALVVSPSSSILHLAYATALAEQGRYAESILHGKKAIEIKPNYAEAHSDLGSRLSDLGRHKRALKHHRKAVALRPSAPEAHYNYANALSRSGDLPAARAAYERALQHNPSFAPAHHNLANLKRQSGEVEEAIAHYQAALEANPRLSGTHYQLALTLITEGQLEAAAKHFRRTYEIDPTHVEAREKWLSIVEAPSREHE